MKSKKKDRRYKKLGTLIKKKKIHTLNEILQHIPADVLATDIGIKINSLVALMENPARLKLAEIMRMSELFEIDSTIVFQLIVNSLKSE